MVSPSKVFISYAHEDTQSKEKLVVHLQGLIQQGLLSSWHDGLLVAGQRWNETIAGHLDGSRLLLLLVSPYSIASDYINNVELKRTAERYDRGEVWIVPVLVRNTTGWQDTAFGAHRLGDFQALPDNLRFIMDWENEDAAWADVVEGIRKVVVEHLSLKDTTGEVSYRDCHLSMVFPRAPVVGFVSRRDADGRDIVEHLKEELAPGGNKLVMLSGPGGVGKTTLAFEAACALKEAYGGRIVWSDAERRADYTLISVFDDIFKQLGNSELVKLPSEEKRGCASALIAHAPTLIVLDTYETIAPEEQVHIKAWLERAQCSALLVSRERAHDMPIIPAPFMSPEESYELIKRLVAQAQGPQIFTEEICRRICETAEGRPTLIEWIVAQIDGTMEEPHKVLDQVRNGEGDAAERVFDLSFNLAQLGDDGRAVLLALSLFKPSATREALAVVAGFCGGQKRLNKAIEKRLNKAIENLRRLWLIKGDQNSRLRIEGLTLTMTAARLSQSKLAPAIYRRFVAYFREHTLGIDWTMPLDPADLSKEKSNIVRAIQVAPLIKDWDTVVELYDVTFGAIHSFKAWREAIELSERYAEQKVKAKNHPIPIIIEIHHKDKEGARIYYESLEQKIDKKNLRLLQKVVLSAVIFQFGVFVYDKAEGEVARQHFEEARELYQTAREYFEEAERMKKSFHDWFGAAIASNNLGVIIAKARAGKEDSREKARAKFYEALETFQDYVVSVGRGSGFAKATERNLEWLDSLD